MIPAASSATAPQAFFTAPATESAAGVGFAGASSCATGVRRAETEGLRRRAAGAEANPDNETAPLMQMA